MKKISKRYEHFVFGVIQSGITCFVASAISSLSAKPEAGLVGIWLKAWSISWATMLPVVILVAPAVRKASHFFVASS